ncbi:MAG TPA: SIS domain-containing protein [Nocardioidaceae bacterium]|nr:SIS domain-containing protein [Nocardioidaceae bacterium]
MSALDAMIAAQPEAIERVASLDVEERAAALRPATRVVLVGTGTSQHAAELGAVMFAQAGRVALAVPSSAFAHGAVPVGPGDGVIVISHTTDTAFARRARDLAVESGAALASVTGVVGRWPEAVETVAKEQAETYTVSYTAALAALAVLAGALGATEYHADAVRGLLPAVEAALASELPDALEPPPRALAVVGAGLWGVTAREGALKVREGARLLAEGFDAEYFLHGSAVPLTADDRVLLLEPAADPDGLVAALGRAAAAEGIPVASWSLPAASAAPPALAQIPTTILLQRLAARWAAKRSQDPDVAIVGAWADPSLWELGGPGAG